MKIDTTSPLPEGKARKQNGANHKNLRIGSKLQHARLVQGLQLKDVAERVRCSESMLSKIENEKAEPSLQLLHKIAAELDISIGTLFSEEPDEPRIVLREGSRPSITTHSLNGRNSKGVTLEWVVPYPESKLLSGSIHIVAPGGGSEGQIVHKGEELGYILQGTLELHVDGDQYTLEPGDSFFFSSDRPHGYRNPGEIETKVLWINTPPTF